MESISYQEWRAPVIRSHLVPWYKSKFNAENLINSGVINNFVTVAENRIK